jgi:hypothetical protein
MFAGKSHSVLETSSRTFTVVAVEARPSGLRALVHGLLRFGPLIAWRSALYSQATSLPSNTPPRTLQTRDTQA